MPAIGTPTLTRSSTTPRPKVNASLDQFVYWIRERTNIHLKRRAGRPKPWSTDPIFQSSFFTTPFREWDKSTVWLRENVRGPLSDDPKVLFAVAAFRWFNLPSTGERLHSHGLLTDWNTKLVKQTLNGFFHHGGKIFSGAYRVAPPMLKGDSKIDTICDLLDDTWKQRHELVTAIERCRTLRQAWERLTMLSGIGPFIGYELVTDLRWTYLLRDATDIMTWANPGPGAARGMNRLLGRPVKDTCWDWLSHANKLLATLQKRLRKMPKPHPFEMREVEHSLCEFDKFQRVVDGGRSKRRFDGA